MRSAAYDITDFLHTVDDDFRSKWNARDVNEFEMPMCTIRNVNCDELRIICGM